MPLSAGQTAHSPGSHTARMSEPPAAHYKSQTVGGVTVYDLTQAK
jgi:hypothetical protein